MAPLHVDGAHPRRAGNPGSSSSGTTPRPSADAIARSRQLAAAFTAQVELTMLQSLSQLGAAGDQPAGDDSGEGGGGGGDLGFAGGLDQMQLMATLFSGARKRGASAATLQAQLSALGGLGGAGAASGLGGGFAQAGAGGEALLAQQLMASLASPETSTTS